MQKKFTHDITVRFFDLDANNHVNNSVYLTYMEEARTKVLIDHYLALKDTGIHFVVAEVQCKYKKPIRLTDKVTIELTIEPKGRASFNIFYIFKNPQGEIYAKGRTLMACFNEKTQRPARIPEGIFQKVGV